MRVWDTREVYSGYQRPPRIPARRPPVRWRMTGNPGAATCVRLSPFSRAEPRVGGDRWHMYTAFVDLAHYYAGTFSRGHSARIGVVLALVITLLVLTSHIAA